MATVATVIASQAVITGAYSLTQQAVQLGLLPRFAIRHTSESLVGQIYMPRVNWLLLAAVIALVLLFGSSSALANAYGIAVTGAMVVNSLLAFTVFRLVWRWPLALALAVLVAAAAIEVSFFGANLLKFFHGGYVPVFLAARSPSLMATWVRGTSIVSSKAHTSSTPLRTLIEMLKKSQAATRAPGTAVFLTSDPENAPSALLHNLKHNHVLHERNILLSVSVATTPRVPDESGCRSSSCRTISSGSRLATATWRSRTCPRALALARKLGVKFDIMSTTFFLSRRSFRASPQTGMPLWQDHLFITLSKSGADAASFYRLPSNRVVELGQQLIV